MSASCQLVTPEAVPSVSRGRQLKAGGSSREKLVLVSQSKCCFDEAARGKLEQRASGGPSCQLITFIYPGVLARTLKILLSSLQSPHTENVKRLLLANWSTIC